jgi:DNA invertase Pin-like site-specific DNA recombinase
MMKAAIYTRRSTEEHQNMSLEIQRAEAEAFIRSQGWSLAEGHLYVDDAISRAEFKKRPGLIALLNAANRHEFDVVVCRDETRLGGDQNRTALVIQDLLDSGVRLFYHFTKEEVNVDSAVSKFIMSARLFAAELEREKTAQRTREHLEFKAKLGANVGGRCYGYDNVEVLEGGQRIRVEYRVNESQAAIIREIFSRYAKGEGIKTIAKDLNRRGVRSPCAGKRGTGSWAQGAMYPMLRRDRYRGVLIWGKEGSAYKGGTQVRVFHEQPDWVTVEKPELRIISEELWQAVQDRIGKNEKLCGQKGPKGPKPRYLLSGLARCSVCGGPIHATNGKQGKKTIKVYACNYHRNRGETVCTNSFRRPVEGIDDAVIEWVEQNLFREQVILEAIAEVRCRLSSKDGRAEGEILELEGQVRKLGKEIANLTNALATSDVMPPSIVQAIADRENQLLAGKTRLEALRDAPEILEGHLSNVEDEARRRLADLRGLIKANPDEGRRVLETILDGPLTFTPMNEADGSRRYLVTGKAIGARALFTTGSDPNGIRNCPGVMKKTERERDLGRQVLGIKSIWRNNEEHLGTSRYIDLRRVAALWRH